MRVYFDSLKGSRDQNEDKHYVLVNDDNKNPTLKNINMFAVFDGHGGKTVSKYVSEVLPKFFTKKELKYPLSEKYINQVYDEVQGQLIASQSAKECGSTSLVVLQYEDKGKEWLSVLNSGDSRCVICRDNLALPLSKDHKPSWPDEQYRINSLGGKIVSDGYELRIKSLSVSRAFGDVAATPYVTHRPEIYKYEISPKDKFIVLGCDGLWDVLSCQDVVNFILYSCYDNCTTKRINQPTNIAGKLGEFAIKKGSTDNITIIIAFLK
jgi:protein phosphatase 1L